MSRLFDDFQFGSLTAKNRIMVSAMCQYSSEDGFATNWHLVHLGSRAVGGAGIVMTEATAVLAEGRISYADLGIWKDEHVPKLKEIATFITEQGSIPAIQLAHAGRKASKDKPWEGNHSLAPDAENGWQTVAPSSIPFNEGDSIPHSLTTADIKNTVTAFVDAAKRAVKAGFKILEIHAAHGYLVHQFLSPLSNKRVDEYGGSFANRTRFLLEIIEQMNAAIPSDISLFVRISATDWMEGVESWDLEQSIALAQELKKVGVELIDVSSGGLAPEQKIIGGAGYQTEFASRIRKEAKIKTGAVGLITTPSQAEHIIRTEQADLVIIGREFLRNPYFPLHAVKELRSEQEWPDQYKRAR